MIFQHLNNITSRNFHLFGPVTEVKTKPSIFKIDNFSFKQKEKLLIFNLNNLIKEVKTPYSKSIYTYDEKNNLISYLDIDLGPYGDFSQSVEVSFKTNSFTRKFEGMNNGISTFTYFANAYFLSEKINFIRGADFNEHYTYYNIKYNNVYTNLEYLSIDNSYTVNEFFWLDTNKNIVKRCIVEDCGFPRFSGSENILKVIKTYIYTYFQNGNFSSITLFEEDKITYSKYNIEGQLLLKEVRDNEKNIIKSEKFEYDKNFLLLSESQFDSESGSNYKINYIYKFDKYNNWTKKIFSMNGCEIGFVQREIKYAK